MWMYRTDSSKPRGAGLCNRDHIEPDLEDFPWIWKDVEDDYLVISGGGPCAMEELWIGLAAICSGARFDLGCAPGWYGAGPLAL